MADKIKKVVDQNGEFTGQLIFECPGCGSHHAPNVLPNIGKPAWGWNNSLDKPTFTPSILSQYERFKMDYEEIPEDAWTPWTEKKYDGIEKPVRSREIKPELKSKYIEKVVCHSYVTAGRIQFLGDCTHKLAGQTIDLMDIE